mmetsp:Transcript_28149/g.43934  ORF Transcript_28149/g.43934 Transcript_28149/m.43934 type:complete len:568 (+) Transcript_28149:738-2441(+)
MVAEPPLPSQAGEFQWWGMEKLLKPLDIRFKYHFRGTKKTNRLDKPEWFFSYQLSRMKENSQFLECVVQPTIAVASQGVLSKYDAFAEFCSGLVQQCSDKVSGDSTMLLEEGELLIKTIEESLSFDSSVTEIMLSSNRRMAELSSTKLSCVSEISKNRMMIHRWCQLEVTMASAEISRLLLNPNAFELRHIVPVDEEEEAPDILARDGENWGTLSAQGAVAALEAVSERYKRLQSPSERARFYKIVQEETILQAYLEGLRSRAERWIKEWELFSKQRREEAVRLRQHTSAKLARDALDVVAYAASTEKSSAPEVSAADVELRTLAGLISSAKYCQSALGEVGDTEHFLDLQNTLITQNPDSVEDPDAGIFDEIISDFTKFAIDLAFQVAHVVATDFQDSAAVYETQGRMWTSELKRNQAGPEELSPEICEPITILRSHLTTVRTYMHPDLASQVWREIAEKVDRWLFEKLSKSGMMYSSSGAVQLRQDMEAVTRQFNSFTKRPENFLKNLKEACILLNLEKDRAKKLLQVLNDPRNKEREEELQGTGVFLISVDAARSLLHQRTDTL